MKIKDIITEAAADNRPDMQIPEAEPENPGRRGFLKGAGAAAVGAAGLASAGKSSAESYNDYGNKVTWMLVLYYICKDPDAAQFNFSCCPRVQASIRKFANRNDLGMSRKTSGKTILNSWYQDVKRDMDNMKHKHQGDLRPYYSFIQGIVKNDAESIISDFESLNEF